ncbi:MAG: Eco57I restriction-modification methylase domain-containing protein [Candidatus Helarchaeota archaeon]
MNKNGKAQLGQYITSIEIADLMISLISSKYATGKILEPSFGTGVFLDLLYEKGFNNIYGVELDETFYALIAKKFPDKLSYYQNNDYLKTPREEKFDIIIGNPPYVYYNNIPSEILAPLKQNPFWVEMYNGEWDLLYFFIVWSIEKLNPLGELIFITPYYWFNSTYASSLRKYLLENGRFDTIIHFGEMNLFQGCAPNTIIFKYIKGKTASPIRVIEYKKRKGDTQTISQEIKNFIKDFPDEEFEDEQYRIFYMEQITNPFFWYLIKPSEQKLCESIETSTLVNIPKITIQKHTLFPKSVFLHELLDEKDLISFSLNKKKYHPTITNRKKWYVIPPYKNQYLKLKHVLTVSVGMVTGFDKAFRLNEDEYHNLNEIEKNHVIKCIKGQNCERFFTNSSEFYIYVDDINDELELKSEFPNFYMKLAKYKSELRKRYNIKDKPWFHWATIRNKEIYELNRKRYKIFVPCLDRHKYSRFSISNNDVYGSGDTLAIVKSPHSFYKLKESLKYITAWLNSSYIQKWYKIKGSKRGHRTQYTQSYLEEIPIRVINWQDDTEISLYEHILTTIDEVLRAKTLNSKLEKELDNTITALIKRA